MAKNKRSNAQKSPSYNEKEQVTLKDQLSSDVLSKLQQAKSSLVEELAKKEQAEKKRLAEERKQNEKNMSFEELLEKYGDLCSKY